jgi:hypothetical protein
MPHRSNDKMLKMPGIVMPALSKKLVPTTIETMRIVLAETDSAAAIALVVDVRAVLAVVTLADSVANF